ncbi:cysteine proteinase [Sporormia fimetaria CBS 119925]|uniref:Ubiquitin carboxyl-terminal hydrolase n=1 Tax=Sporormia fimetaria CBS 119925 TaxID=1340428 RepID=A0A6A6VB77_9PLEO|nr:cysteine proteinase [Sporormia fimetaria CBS 119925]
MPDKPLTIATYAAGASLAAITLIYVFGPTFFLDEDISGKKKGAVGLVNAANDCFINSILQVLAGLPDLRVYLIRETHRRNLDGQSVYDVGLDALEGEKSNISPEKLEGLQKGMVTSALKEILDSLNERPLHRKTISPQPFIRVLERAFRTHVSRQQQDAQEFLQVVMERLCDEYHAGAKARERAMKKGLAVSVADTASGRQEIAAQFGVELADAPGEGTEVEADDAENAAARVEEGFPLEGQIESQIECLTCGFKPKPSVSTFVTLTLNVPQQSSTSLNACFDGMFKVEHIDDFKCEYCRLQHAIDFKAKQLSRAPPSDSELLHSDIDKLRQALAQDPESPPEGVELPDSKLAPRCRIARHMRISSFPKVLAVHLSRSVFAFGSMGTKNMAKVAFPETLPLGSILDQRKYRLLGTIMHKGNHHSGHYESFRRQVQPVPFSTPHSFGAGGVYSMQHSPNPSVGQSPRISTSNLTTDSGRSPTLHSPSINSLSSQSSQPQPSPAPTPKSRDENSLQAPPSKPKSLKSLKEKASGANGKRKLKSKQSSNRWWRISDDKIKESKTADVLSMQKEVYLLFYELEKQ